MTYRFNKDVETLQSPYISWENLNCCGGWVSDDSYLLTAVQEGKKLCASIIFDTEKELEGYKKSLTDEYDYFCRPTMYNGPYSFFYIDVCRTGAIRDYINEDDILQTYDLLGIKGFNRKLLLDLLGIPMLYLINGETFSFRDPVRPEEWIVTGLLLGYPLESTAWLLEKHDLLVSQF